MGKMIMVTCPVCHGSGQEPEPDFAGDAVCHSCRGERRVEAYKPSPQQRAALTRAFQQAAKQAKERE